jgi:hypothetical protein
MKTIISLLVAAVFAMPAMAADAPATPETKKVCVMQKDAKTGKEKEVCKTIKIHKKHEGTKVPDKAPAKTPPKKEDKKPAKKDEKKN